jgi:soluble lytic murein transglycosylase
MFTPAGVFGTTLTPEIRQTVENPWSEKGASLPRSERFEGRRGARVLGVRLLCTFLVAFAIGAAAGARGESELAALHPLDSATADPQTEAGTLRAALSREARHLGGELREAVAAAIIRAERDHGIPALLLVSLIMQESGFDPTAENGGALGLLQLRPFVAKDYAARRGLPWQGERTLLDPVRNIQLASGYLGELLARFGSVDLALEAYNKGPELVKSQLRAGEAGPTPRFVKSVLGRYQSYNARYAGF